MRLRVGIIGLGCTWEHRHKPALRALSDRFEVRAVYDQVAHRAAHVAEELGCDAAEGFTAIIERRDIDAVFLLTPQWFRLQPILTCCRVGKPVYCEKALELEIDRAAELGPLIKQSGITCMVEFAGRLWPVTVRLKELLASRLGPATMVFCDLRSLNRDNGNPYTSWVEDGLSGSFLEVGIRLADWCTYVLGREPTSVQAFAGHFVAPEPAEDFESLLAEFGPGAFAQITLGRYLSARWPAAARFRRPPPLQVVAERGVAMLDPPHELAWFDVEGPHHERLESERPVGEMLAEMFYRGVAEKRGHFPTIDDDYRATQLVLEARRSHREGRRLAVSIKL